MPNPLVECIPNFSEARNPDVINKILDAIQSVDDIRVLDHSSDDDHNRTVVTFVGPPIAVEEAAYQAIKTASQLINLDEHTGEHPRLGATDVVPFVPIKDISLNECVEIARRLGKRVGDELSIPIYLYEAAAARPERQNLENIRRGEYEVLKTELGVKPEREPDFGPARLTPAGATVIGARAPLIAYNVFLNTDDVSLAQKIAKNVRHSSGGFRYVKALGLLVEGRAQVSMNLTNYQQTPIHRVVETIRSEAERYGIMVHHSELIGLIPQAALRDAAVWYLQLDGFQPDQVLEEKLTQNSTKDNDVVAQIPGGDLLDLIAAATPTPGGGSAAAFAGAMSASLAAMVSRLTVGKKKYVGVESRMREIINQSDDLRAKLLSAMTDDSAAFEDWMTALRLPRDTEDQQKIRAAAIEVAARNAIDVPLQSARLAHTAMQLALECAQTGNLNAISDAGSAGELANAAIIAAGYNVRINCLGLEDKSVSEKYITEARKIEAQAADTLQQLRETLSSRGNFPLK